MHRTANPATPVRLRARPPARPNTHRIMDITYPRHGGDLAFARARYGEMLDLSTGVCPYRYGPLSGHLRGLERLPGTDDLDRLVATARRAYGVPADCGSDRGARQRDGDTPHSDRRATRTGRHRRADVWKSRRSLAERRTRCARGGVAGCGPRDGINRRRRESEQPRRPHHRPSPVGESRPGGSATAADF